MSEEQTTNYRGRPMAAFAHELGVAAGALVGGTLGLAMIMSGVLTAWEESEAWWEWLISVPLALVVVALGCGIAVVSAGSLVERIAVGWYGIWVRRRPAKEYGPQVGNGARAVADVVYTVAALVLGVLLFRAGARGGELNWAVEGLLLAFSGLGFGLGAFVPRLYFRKSGREIKVRDLALPESWAALVVAATLGVGLSFGVCRGFAEAADPPAETAREEAQ